MRGAGLALAVVLAATAGSARAETVYVPLSARNVTAAIDRVGAADAIVVTGQVPTNGAGSIQHILRFAIPSNILRGTVNWSIAGRTRLVGLNLDLLTADNVVVGSDVFTGTLAGRTAVSTLDVSTLTPNAVYLLKLTGTQVTGLNYSITLEFGPP